MRSSRAINVLVKATNMTSRLYDDPSQSDMKLYEAKLAVEVAEADARERAIKALCHQSCYGKCPLVVPYSGCGKMNAFLGFYDKTE